MNEKVEIKPMPDDYDFSSAPKVTEGQLPTWDEDDQESAKEGVLVEVSKSFAPKIMIYGCGGFGVNVMRKLPAILELHDANIHYRIFDTSMANVHKEPMPNGVEVIMVGEDGKGKLRGTNLDILSQKVDQLIFTDQIETDLDIIICSLSGGTGSVVGPLLARSIMRQDKPVIIFCVADGASHTDTVNTINTIKTLENFGKEGYLNVVPFDNRFGYRAVDEAILEKCHAFIEATNLDIVKWLDKSDIVTAMRPFSHKMLKDSKGMFMTKILIGDTKMVYHQPVCYDDTEVPFCHSVIQVADPNLECPIGIMSSVSYHGKWTRPNPKNITIQFGLPLPEVFNKTYQDLLNKGQAASTISVKQTGFKIEGSEQDDSGIVF